MPFLSCCPAAVAFQCTRPFSIVLDTTQWGLSLALHPWSYGSLFKKGTDLELDRQASWRPLVVSFMLGPQFSHLLVEKVGLGGL